MSAEEVLTDTLYVDISGDGPEIGLETNSLSLLLIEYLRASVEGVTVLIKARPGKVVLEKLL